MFRIRKSIHLHPIHKAKRKSKAAQEVLDKLNAFLDATEPEPVYFLTRLWNDQQQAITYKELREAILNGYIDVKTIQAWQNDYANFVNEHLKPLWIEAMQAANADLMAAHPEYFFDPMSQGVLKWINEHGAQWVTVIAEEQKEAISAMLQHAYSGAFTVDELARAIRATIGLNKVQAKANLNYYQHVKKTLLENNPGMKESTAQKKAQEAAAKYAAKQHRQRAYTIATTEMAFAYNKGADEGIRQAQEQNLIGKVVKVWSTAADERVCEICGALDGVEVEMGADFDFKGNELYSGQKETPPAHPRCRCALLYVEKEPPKYQAVPDQDMEYKILEGKSAREWGENDSKEWADNLSIPEREAIRRYTEQSYEYNNLLRRGEKPDGGKKRVQEVEKDIALIDKALKKGKIGDNVIVYRGTSIQALGFPPKAKPTVQELEKLKGKIIVDKGFMSTTLDRKVISAFDGSTYSRQIVNIEIHVPKGTKGSYIGRVSKTPNEAEILFPKGTKMKIKEVKVETTGFNKKRISLITEVVI